MLPVLWRSSPHISCELDQGNPISIQQAREQGISINSTHRGADWEDTMTWKRTLPLKRRTWRPARPPGLLSPVLAYVSQELPSSTKVKFLLPKNCLPVAKRKQGLDTSNAVSRCSWVFPEVYKNQISRIPLQIPKYTQGVYLYWIYLFFFKYNFYFHQINCYTVQLYTNSQ